MAIGLRTAGSWAAANATTQTVTLPTHQAGDMLLVRVGFKHATMPTTVTCGTAGWAKIGEKNSAGGASSNGGGGVQVAVFWKVAASGAETNPVITFNAGAVAATPSAAVANAYSKAAGESWLTPVGDGSAFAAATSISDTIDSHISATAGDLIEVLIVTNDNTTLTVPTVTQASLTLAAVVESPAAALSSATSNDIAADGAYRIATAGTSSAAAVVTGTNSVADEGCVWTTRLRVATTETHSGTLTATGGGIATEVGAKGGQSAVTATGAGVATFAYEVASVENHDGTVTATGGGVATLGASTVRAAALTATASGAATFVGSGARAGIFGATASGVAAFTSLADRQGPIVATGAGEVSLSVTSARLAAALMSGGGVLTSVAVTQRYGDLTATGGGSATFTGSAGEIPREGTLTATGGGSTTLEATTGRYTDLDGTASGQAAFTVQGDHSAILTATGGGAATFAIDSSNALPDIILASVDDSTYGGTISTALSGGTVIGLVRTDSISTSDIGGEVIQ